MDHRDGVGGRHVGHSLSHRSPAGIHRAGLFAQMAGTLDNITGGRIDINVVPGGIQGDFDGWV